MARKRPSPATFDVAAVASGSPHATRRTPWMSEDAATVALALVDLHPEPSAIQPREIEPLLAAIAGISGPRDERKLVLGGRNVSCSAHKATVDHRSVFHSPRVGGVHVESTPPEPGAAAIARRMIEQELSSRRYKGPGIVEVRDNPKGRRYGYRTLEVELVRPEGGGTYVHQLDFEHQTDDGRMKAVRACADFVVKRWRNRYHLAGLVHAATLWARDRSEGIDGLEFLGVEISYLSFKANEDAIESAYTLCSHSVIDDNLERTVSKVSGHNGDAFSQMATKHRRGMRKLAAGGTTGTAASAWTVHPVLAAAIRARMEKYGAQLLVEIEEALKGGAAKPENPRLRGIANIRMRKGELVAHVTLAKGCRLFKDRVNVRSVKSMPQQLLDAMKGKRMRDVIDHPWLEGVIIAGATVVETTGSIHNTTAGLNLTPQYTSEPLQPLLDELRAAFGTGKGKGDDA